MPSLKTRACSNGGYREKSVKMCCEEEGSASFREPGESRGYEAGCGNGFSSTTDFIS
jgi:hypothetical protein